MAALAFTSAVRAWDERGEAKYPAIMDSHGRTAPTHISIPFADFRLAQESRADLDDNLGSNQLTTLGVTDALGMLGNGGGHNRLWIGPIRAVSAH